MLNSLITSKTRLKMLIKFFVNAANNGYLNGLANEFNESTNSIRKELNNLSGAGYLLKSKKNNKIIYNANTSHPMFAILQKIVRQHLGLEDIIETIIERIGDIDEIILIGDYARGIDSGNIEIVINGSQVNNNYLDSIRPKIEKKISRNIIFHVNQKINSNHIIIYNKEI
ncbi:ArsR family transcriptional regulator [Flavobacteriales bacterium]|nr:ArsR family transcriptional regulator [Flavobacteriales bacterium]